MGLRLAHVGRVSEQFTRRQQDDPAVDPVLHPFVPSCPGHEVWARDIKGSGGVFSIVLKPGMEANFSAALTALKVFAIGPSGRGHPQPDRAHGGKGRPYRPALDA